jgi:hypothetical protein
MRLSRIALPVLALVWTGCGGSQDTTQSPGPVPLPEASAPAGDTAAELGGAPGAEPAAPDPSATRPGPQITPQGVRFNYRPSRKPGKIYLAGNFNNWNPSNEDYVLKDPDGDGMYSIIVPLQPGTYQYKFVIDGTWTKDPNSPMAHPDGFGGQNGKFEVPAGQ